MISYGIFLYKIIKEIIKDRVKLYNISNIIIIETVQRKKRVDNRV